MSKSSIKRSFLRAVQGERRPPRLLWWHWRQRAARFTAGGGWTDQLHSSVQRNLRWFWLDGVFAQASESIVVAYLSLFLLALGATAGQIGLMSALSNLSAALLVLPGAAIVERWGRRKQTCLIGGGGIARGTLLLLALLPLAFTGSAAIYTAITLAVIRIAFGNLSVPAWTSLTADIVPLRWRGRYFASRNVAMGVASMAVTYVVGQLITRAGNPAGYQLAMGIAFTAGILSTFSFAQIEEPSIPHPNPPPLVKDARKGTGEGREGVAPQAEEGRESPISQRQSWSALIQDLRSSPNFIAFCAIAALWNLSINVAGPFFSVYLVGNLKASAGFVGALAVINGLAALPGQRLFGMLSDRWGPRRVQLVTGLLIPLVPWGWAISRAPWQVIPAELASGFLWAGYGLSSFNFLLTMMPEDRRERYSALYQIVVTATLAIGAAIGGVIATQWGYATTMIVSGFGRLAAALLFVRFVRQPTSTAR